LRFFQNAVASKGPFAELDAYWELDLLVVSPDYQRRSVGGALIEESQHLASKDALPLILFASVVGEPLYGRKGFVTLDRMNLIQGLKPSAAMIWEPDTIKGKYTPA